MTGYHKIDIDIISTCFSDVINNANAHNLQSQITLSLLFKELIKLLTNKEKEAVIEKCKVINCEFDLNKDYYKVIFLKIYIANKNKVKKKKCDFKKDKTVEEKIKKFAKKEKFSKLFDFLDLNYKKRIYCNEYVKQYFKLLSVLKTELLNKPTLKMYFCDLLFKDIDSTKRVSKLAKELTGIQGSNILSSIQAIFENDAELCDFIGTVNRNFNEDVEINQLFEKSKELYFAQHRFNLENAEKQFLKRINKDKETIDKETLKKEYEKLLHRTDPYTSGKLDKHQNTKIVYQSIKEKVKN